MKHLFTVLAFLLLVLLNLRVLNAQMESDMPKLVVGIVVDQMRYDRLDAHRNRFGQNGFNRLLTEGFNFKNANYGYVPTFTAPGHASIYTGCSPSVHGIIGNSWFDRSENKAVISVEDSTQTLVGSKFPNPYGLSPQRLLISTISDQLRMATNDQAKVISISLKDRGAILPGGYKANAAYWHDWESSPGYFVSSTYYMDTLPEWVSRFNQKERSDTYLNQNWETLYPIETYTASAADDNRYERAIGGKQHPTFPYNFKELRERFKDSGSEHQLLWLSPYGNELLTEFALEAIKKEEMGQDGITDMLLISYTVTDIIGHTLGQQSVEMEDVILRLDRNIAELLKQLDKKIGAGQYLLFLTSDHGGTMNGSKFNDIEIPAGVASIGRYKIGLTGYLIKKYGAHPWILHFDNEQLYLNRNLISELKLDLTEIQQEAAKFLQSQDGIADAVTAHELQTVQYPGGMRKLIQNGFFPERSGDVILTYEPGYVFDQRTNLRADQIKGSIHGSGYAYDTHVPLLWFGKGIKKGESVRDVSGTDIAPTLAKFLKLPANQHYSGNTLEELFGNFEK